MSLEPGHHRHRAGEDERTAVLHRRTARTEKIRVLDHRKERGKGISRTLTLTRAESSGKKNRTEKEQILSDQRRNRALGSQSRNPNPRTGIICSGKQGKRKEIKENRT